MNTFSFPPPPNVTSTNLYSGGGGAVFNAGYGHHAQHPPPGTVYGYGTPAPQPYPTPQQQPGYYGINPGGGGGPAYGFHSPMTQWKAYFTENQHAWTDSSFINFVLNMPWYIILFITAFVSFILLLHINPSYVQQKPEPSTDKTSSCVSTGDKSPSSTVSASGTEASTPDSPQKKYPPSLVRVGVCALVISSVFLILCYLLLRVLVGTLKIQRPMPSGGLPMQQQTHSA